MENNQIKVLQIIRGSDVTGKKIGGISKLLYDLYTAINKKHNDIKFDFLSPYGVPLLLYSDEIQKYNSNLYSLKTKIKGFKNKINYYLKLKAFLKTHNYDIVHINSGSSFFNLISALAVKKTCNSKIVIHCHNSIDNCNFLKKIFVLFLKPFISKVADYYLACSKYVGMQMFSKKIINSDKFYVLPNAIKVNLFKFDENVRKKIRKQYNISDDSLVIGHIGRFELQKNHKFIIELFNKIYEKNNNVYLILIGDGSLKNEIIKKVKDLNLEDNVIFTGVIKNVNDYLNAFDIFVFPSLYEGFGTVVIESQASGLKTIASKELPLETKVTDLIEYLDLIIDEWCNKILNIKMDNNRLKYNRIIEKSNYEIEKASKILLEIYNSLLMKA